MRVFTAAGEWPFPALIYFHGGGWASNFVEHYDAQLTSLCTRAEMVVIAVNYQKAPEHKFPIPFDECLPTLQWALAKAGKLNINPNILGVGGDSAGGNLASAVAHKARDEGDISLAFRFLI